MPSLPDLGRPLVSPGCTLYPPADGVGPCTAVPHALRLATRPDGTPDLHLELVRSSGPRRSVHGLLDLRVEAACDPAVAAAALAAAGLGGTADPVVWQGGTVRLVVPGPPAGAAPQPLVQALHPTALGVLRVVQRLEPAAALLVEGLLGGGVLPRVVVDTELLGAAPRVPAEVVVDPGRLLADVRGLVVSWSSLRERCAAALEQHRAGLPGGAGLEVHGDVPDVDTDTFVTAVAALVREHVGALAAGPDGASGPYVEVLAPGPEEPVSRRWDLALLHPVHLPVSLELAPPAALVADLVAGGLDRVRSFVDVPLLQTGFRTVDVSANLPPGRSGVVLGVRVRKDATPSRPVPVDAFAVFEPPDDRVALPLQLSPSEDPAVQVNTVVQLAPSAGAAPGALEGEVRTTAAATLLVGPDDFPVRFVTVSVGAELLQQGRVDGALRWSHDGGDGTAGFAVDAEHLARTLVLPRDAGVGPLTVRVTAPDGREALVELAAPPRSPVVPALFPGVGAHAVEVRCADVGAGRVVAAEFLPEGAPDVEEERRLLLFTADTPVRTYHWSSSSVFSTGYRFRLAPSSGAPGPWSALQPPDRALDLAGVR